MASNQIPMCIRCCARPTLYKFETAAGLITYYIKCFGCNVTTPRFAKEGDVLRYWGVKLANDKTLTQPISKCKACKSPANLVKSRDALDIEMYTIRCNTCPARTSFPRKSVGGVIETWNKLYGVK